MAVRKPDLAQAVANATVAVYRVLSRSGWYESDEEVQRVAAEAALEALTSIGFGTEVTADGK